MTTSTSKLAAFIGMTGIAAAGALVAAPALAARVPEATNAEVVRYGDIDLNSDRGAEKLYERLSHAAREVCGATRDPLYIASWRLDRECEHAAVGRAVDTLGLPRLTAAYDRHSAASADTRRVSIVRARTNAVGG